MITSTLSYPTCQKTHTWRPLFRHHPLHDYVPGLRCQSRHHFRQIMFPSPEYVALRSLLRISPYAEDRLTLLTQSPDYVLETDPEADPEEDDDEDPEEDPIDYPADGGDDRMTEMDGDEDDDMDMERLRRIRMMRLMLRLTRGGGGALSSMPTCRLLFSSHYMYQPWSDSEVARLLAISSPPASPLSPWSSSPPQNSFPYHHLTCFNSANLLVPIRSLGYRAATIRMRAEAAATSHSLPLPHPYYSFLDQIGTEVNLPPRERLGIALGPRYEVGESSAAAAARPARGLREDYVFVATMDREISRDPERYVGYGITDS
ncbi:hypothetical protein Tco_1126924 [Tanacetum coccineum]